MRNEYRYGKRDNKIKEALNYYSAQDAMLKEEEEKKKASISASYANGNLGAALKKRKANLKEEKRMHDYPEHFLQLALTEALSYVVNESLLLNTDEYAKVNPHYKDEIKSHIRGFLENGKINDSINNAGTLSLIEEIHKETPNPKLYLTEEDEKAIINNKILSNATIKRNLDHMSGDVKTRVANIVAKDTLSMADEQDNINKANNKENNYKMAAAQIITPVTPLVPASVLNQTPATEVVADPDAPADTIEVNQQPEATDTVAADAAQNAVPMVKEEMKHGIVETLAINEGTDMLRTSGAVDPTIAIAKALTLVTCLEALDDSQIVTIGTPGYSRILNANGVSTINSTNKLPFADMSDHPVMTVTKTVITTDDKDPDSDLAKDAQLDNTATPQEQKLNADVKDALKISEDSIAASDTETAVEPFSKWKANHTPAAVLTPEVQTEESLTGKYTDIHGKVYTESEVYDFFENNGYGDIISEDLFEDLCHSWNFLKH